MITIGSDPHKASHTAIAMDPTGGILGEVRVSATRTMLERLRRWAERIWAIEGAPGLGHLPVQQLVARSETVLDVPATLAARARLLDRGLGRKTDAIDAMCVARVAQQQRGLHPVGVENQSAVLRLLADRRDELTGERRRVINRLQRLRRDLRPGGAPTELSTPAASRLLGEIRPASAVERERTAMVRALVANLRRIDRALLENRAPYAAAVAASGTTHTTIFGVSDVLAAKILGHVDDVGRFSSGHAFASYSGTACPGAATDRSTTRSISRPGSRRCTRALDGTTTSASSPNTRRRGRRSAASSVSWRRSSTAISWPIRFIARPSPLEI